MRLRHDEIMETYRARLSRDLAAWRKAAPARPPILVAIDILNDHTADVVGRELGIDREPYVVVNLRDPEKFIDHLDETIKAMGRKAREN